MKVGNVVALHAFDPVIIIINTSKLQVSSMKIMNESNPFCTFFFLINICLFSGESLNLLTPTSIHNLIGKHGKLELSLSVSNIFTSVPVFHAGEKHFLC